MADTKNTSCIFEGNTATNVGKLIDLLKMLPEKMPVHSIEPSFDGVSLWTQGNGISLMIAPKKRGSITDKIKHNSAAEKPAVKGGSQ